VTVLHVLFLACFIGGLVLGVFTMLHGVEYTRRSRSRAPSAFFNLPAIATFAVAFGAVGYPLASGTAMTAPIIITIAVASGAAATSATIVMLARWALRTGTVSEGADEIQGQFAVVSEEIGISGTGKISYEYLGRKLNVRARALTSKPLPIGSEVVIDRIQDNVAIVEEWASVEQRL
jgi:membrane protein implicated in regulation of membrane protease activity